MTHEPQQPLNGRPPQEQESFCPYCMSRVAPGQSCPVCGLTQGAYTPAPHHLPLGTILAGRYLVGRALGAVSYTHLDVYKRQDSWRLC